MKKFCLLLVVVSLFCTGFVLPSQRFRYIQADTNLGLVYLTFPNTVDIDALFYDSSSQEIYNLTSSSITGYIYNADFTEPLYTVIARPVGTGSSSTFNYGFSMMYRDYNSDYSSQYELLSVYSISDTNFNLTSDTSIDIGSLLFYLSIFLVVAISLMLLLKR